MKHHHPPHQHDEHAHEHSHDHEHDHGHAEQHAHQHSCGCSGAAASTLAALPAAQATGELLRTPIRILQMDCPTEEALIRNKLSHMPGVQDMEFNLMQRVLTVSHQPAVLPGILAALRSLGFEPQTGDTPAARAAQPAPAAWWPLALAGVAAAAAEVCSWLALPGWLAGLLALAAILSCGLSTYQKGWIALRNRTLNINALMSIAVTGALLLGQWPEAAMVMVLFTLAERIEAHSLERARNAIGSLLQLTPPQAMVQQADGSWQNMALADITIGGTVRVAPGERIALDGVLLAGSSSVNQSAMTGESLPVEKNVGDSVYAGTLNASGSFEYRVTAAANDTMLARIIHAVEQAQGARAPTQRFVDNFARYYTPAVFLLALAVALLPPLLAGGSWHDWLYKALVLLVIACPCALVISTPVTIVSGLAAAARRGILIKGGVWLEQGRHLRWLALDKTGTITHGKPEQTDFVALGEAKPGDYQQLAASLAGRSDHPVSQALSRAAAQQALAPLPVNQFRALPGRGIQGNIAGRDYLLGNQRLLQESGHCPPALATQLAALEAQGKSVVVLLDDSGALALFAVADTIKPGSSAAIAELHQLGVKTLMLSGDNQATATAIASQAGIDEARGNQLPQDKADAIAALAGQGLVGMVGDGINDAPALARADIGFAMGAMGSDTAIETADVALMDDDLAKIPAFVRLSRTTHAILVQNIALALGIKAVFLLLTLLGMGSMWMAVFADVGASLLVVGNGLRLLRK
ncbi:heavy metal translocating P-type ATPase [Aquitalea palustris]|uniref:P-type Zn(2+) transporter n=1 Tax=Aquitalea palustris TaxID=2480983 RepID=A0A454JFK9_9NEIS|nr:heavy metal translocating P-type ATPase [Aquitalea palustris]RMC94560.1 heavy metal translocating P-type ATPase [Aquitalea palustris]